MWLEGTGLGRVVPNLIADRCLSDITAKVERVDQVIGAYFLIRREVFDQLGGFDERFFVYFEEVDISLRALNGGYASCILRDVRACHTGCGSSDQVKTKRLLYFWRSRLLYSGKHFAWPQHCGILLLTFAAEPVFRLLRAALSVSWEAAEVTLGAYLELVRHFSAGTQHDC
jgi:GT2 family glycosyltransferase